MTTERLAPHETIEAQIRETNDKYQAALDQLVTYAAQVNTWQARVTRLRQKLELLREQQLLLREAPTGGPAAAQVDVEQALQLSAADHFDASLRRAYAVLDERPVQHAAETAVLGLMADLAAHPGCRQVLNSDRQGSMMLAVMDTDSVGRVRDVLAALPRPAEAS